MNLTLHLPMMLSGSRCTVDLVHVRLTHRQMAEIPLPLGRPSSQQTPHVRATAHPRSMHPLSRRVSSASNAIGSSQNPGNTPNDTFHRRQSIAVASHLVAKPVQSHPGQTFAQGTPAPPPAHIHSASVPDRHNALSRQPRRPVRAVHADNRLHPSSSAAFLDEPSARHPAEVHSPVRESWSR